MTLNADLADMLAYWGMTRYFPTSYPLLNPQTDESFTDDAPFPTLNVQHKFPHNRNEGVNERSRPEANLKTWGEETFTFSHLFRVWKIHMFLLKIVRSLENFQSLILKEVLKSMLHMGLLIEMFKQMWWIFLVAVIHIS